MKSKNLASRKRGDLAPTTLRYPTARSEVQLRIYIIIKKASATHLILCFWKRGHGIPIFQYIQNVTNTIIFIQNLLSLAALIASLLFNYTLLFNYFGKRAWHSKPRIHPSHTIYWRVFIQNFLSLSAIIAAICAFINLHIINIPAIIHLQWVRRV